MAFCFYNGSLAIRMTRLGEIAHWVIVYFGQFFEKSTEVVDILGYFFSTDKLYITFDKNGLGYILCDFLLSHPVTLLALAVCIGLLVNSLFW
jgi:hypothetical protein